MTAPPKPDATASRPLFDPRPYVFASAHSGWHLYPSNAIPFEDDPVEGTTETVTTGFYIRDGTKRQVVEGTRRAERGREGRVLRQVSDCAEQQRIMHLERES